MKIDTTALFSSKKSISVESFEHLSEDDKKLRQKANDFEAIFIKRMLDEAMKPKSGLLPKGIGSDMYASMYTDTLAKQMSGSMGLGEMIYNHYREKK